MNKKTEDNKMEKIVSLAKRRGFIYQGSSIYGGLAGTWDYGPLGIELKNNLKNLWWKHFVQEREDVYGLDSAILMHSSVWKASGHVDEFTDVLISCKNCKSQFRADSIIEEQKNIDVEGKSLEEIDRILLEDKIKCSSCGKNDWGNASNLVTMFKTYTGVTENDDNRLFLRPETAQGMFVNFKNIIDSFHPKLPFGIAQIGRVFRNEISPRDFIFRVREFEIAELEYFISPKDDWNKIYEGWIDYMRKFAEKIGIDHTKFKMNDLAEDKRAHYSKKTIDMEFPFSFGIKELWAIAYRTDFDLQSHIKGSKVDLSYLDDVAGEKFVPHVIEPTFGVDRTVFAIISDAYTEDDMGGETRTFLKLKPSMAPIKVAVFPLLKNKPQLVEKAREVYEMIKKDQPNGRAGINPIIFDDNGNIGKRYRRQDEIGTPYCVTIDFDTMEDDTVTVRDRDTGKQKRVKINELTSFLIK
jgi:glycyl-tRNA synthetase